MSFTAKYATQNRELAALKQHDFEQQRSLFISKNCLIFCRKFAVLYDIHGCFTFSCNYLDDNLFSEAMLVGAAAGEAAADPPRQETVCAEE